MGELPSGTVTLLLTDIEGSTRLLHELGDRYADVLDEHRRVLRTAFSRHGGVEVDTQGDAFLVAFTRATDAVAAARDAQAGLADGPVRIRVGIHTGEPVVTEEGYVGVDVHRAARVMGAAHGGQVLLSETTQRLLDSTVYLHDLGEHRLKDLTAPQRLYQLGDDVFPPPKTLYTTNLPIQSSALVGRERELEEAGALLRSHRLVTLTGPGGSGKTRLGLQLAADALDAFPDGVFWVPLQALRDPALVERAIGAFIGADDGLAEHISNKRLLMLLDNFEQVIEAAPTIALLIATTPNAKVLVTSREALQVESERRYPVESLPDNEAVTLFVERAQGVMPRFQVTPTVREICRRLDGLPLAIELAAARVALLGPDELLARLDRTLPFLASHLRDAPERQRTLRGTIGWSYELLGAEEQQLFRRLAVFRGSFSIGAAEAICAADLDLLESLVVKSLVRRWDGGRLGMLDTIREYAVERLEESAETDDISHRHAEFFLDLAERANLNPNTYDPTKPIRHDLARQEQNEIYGALSWALQTGSVVLGLRLASAVGGWLWSINSPAEGSRYFERLLENANTDAVPPEILADALREYGAQAFLAGDNQKAERLEEQSLAIYERLGDDHGRAVMLHRLGIAAMWAVDLDRARALVEESHAIHQRRKDQWGVAQTVGALGAIARDAGDLALAYDLIAQSAAIAREIGGGFTDWWASGMLGELACLSLNAGRIDEAETHARDALALADQLHYRAGRVFGVGVLAAIAATRGQVGRAARLWTAIEHEDAVAPLGGWRRHRQACEAVIREVGGPGVADPNARGGAFTLEDAVRLALGDAAITHG
jgi:predicted ATPase